MIGQSIAAILGALIGAGVLWKFVGAPVFIRKGLMLLLVFSGIALLGVIGLAAIGFPSLLMKVENLFLGSYLIAVIVGFLFGGGLVSALKRA